jgi:hypothetical protein
LHFVQTQRIVFLLQINIGQQPTISNSQQVSILRLLLSLPFTNSAGEALIHTTICSLHIRMLNKLQRIHDDIRLSPIHLLHLVDALVGLVLQELDRL